MEKRIFTVLIEKAQGDSVEEVMKNIKEVIEMCLEEQDIVPNEFIGVQKVEV